MLNKPLTLNRIYEYSTEEFPVIAMAILKSDRRVALDIPEELIDSLFARILVAALSDLGITEEIVRVNPALVDSTLARAGAEVIGEQTPLNGE